MAITLVSAGAGGMGINGSGTVALLNTLGATLLVYSAGFFATATPTDSAGNTWTPLTLHTGSGGVQHRVFYVRNPLTSAGHGFSATGTGIYGCGVVWAFTDPAGAPTYEAENGAGGTGTSRQPGSVTPTTSGALIVSGVAIASVQTSITVNAGLAATTFNGSSGVALAAGGGYLVQSPAAAINPTWSWGVAGDHAASIAVFKAAAVAATAKHRKTLSGLGTRVGARRLHGR
jgi:hypothetical protein